MSGLAQSQMSMLLPPGRMLMPVAGKLMPVSAGGTLLAMAPGTGAADTGASGPQAFPQAFGAGAIDTAAIGAQLDQFGSDAASLAREAAAKGAAFAAAKAPVLRAQAERLQGELAGLGARLAQSDTRKTLLARHGLKLGIGALALIVLAGGAFLFTRHQQGAATQDQVNAFLIRAGLEPFVTSQSQSVSLLGATTLSGVTIKDSTGAVVAHIDSIDVADLKLNGAVPQSMKLTAHGITVPVLQLARRVKDEVSQALIGVGYSVLAGDMTINLVDDDASGVLRLDVQGTGNDLGDGELHLVLDHVDAGAIAAIGQVVEAQRSGGPLAAAAAAMMVRQKIKDARLVSVSARIDDTGYHARITALPATGTPPGALGTTPPAIRPPMSEADLVRAGLAPSEAKDALAAITRFQTQGGTLRISSTVDHPLALFNGGGFLGPSFAYDSPAQLLAAAKPKVTN